MYCPECLTEYREGFLECADCRVPLSPGLPPAPESPREIDLVTVLETSDPFVLTLAKSSLEEAGIDYFLSGAGDLLRVGLTHAVEGICRIQVPRESERDARGLLEPLENPPGDLPERIE